MTTPKIAPSTFRFHPHVKDALFFIADRDGRSMSNMLQWLIKQHCEKEGLGWPIEAVGKGETKLKPVAKSAQHLNRKKISTPKGSHA